MKLRKSRSVVRAFALVAASSLMLAGCSGGSANSGTESGEVASGGSDSGVTAEDVAAVLDGDEPVELTVWGWAINQYTPAIEAFEKAYPHIKIDFVTGAGSTEMYTNYQNTVQAGTGIPDVLQFEYWALPQYAASGTLLDFGSESIESEFGPLYNEAAWADSHVAGGLYGIPTDQAPVVMFYRDDILNEMGQELPETMEEFEQVGAAINQKDPERHLVAYYLQTNAQPLLTYLRIAGVKPWTVEGLQDVKLSLQTDEVKEVTDFVRRNIDSGAIGPVSAEGEDFGRAMNDGLYLSEFAGSWRGTNIVNQFPDLDGAWRAALPPTWKAGMPLMNATDGGSVFAISSEIPKEKVAAAIAFANWMGSDPEGVDILVDEGLFSGSVYFQGNTELASEPSPYFGDQPVTGVYFEAANAISTDWDTLPFMQEANVSYGDIVLPAISSGGDIFAALGKWQQHLYEWGNDQGFNVTIEE